MASAASSTHQEEAGGLLGIRGFFPPLTPSNTPDCPPSLLFLDGSFLFPTLFFAEAISEPCRMIPSQWDTGLTDVQLENAEANCWLTGLFQVTLLAQQWLLFQDHNYLSLSRSCFSLANSFPLEH